MFQRDQKEKAQDDYLMHVCEKKDKAFQAEQVKLEKQKKRAEQKKIKESKPKNPRGRPKKNK